MSQLKIERKQRKLKQLNNKELNTKCFNSDFQFVEEIHNTDYKAFKYNRKFKDESMQDTYINENINNRYAATNEHTIRESKDASTSPLKSNRIENPAYEVEYVYRKPETYNEYFDNKKNKEQPNINRSINPVQNSKKIFKYMLYNILLYIFNHQNTYRWRK